jgi:hypothetical protein
MSGVIVPAALSAPGAASAPGANTAVDLIIRHAVLSAFNNVGQARQERSTEQAKQQVTQLLLNLEVETKLHEQLLPYMAQWNCSLVTAQATHPYGKPDYTYTALRRDGSELALVQLPPEVFARGDKGSNPYVSDFANMLKAFRGKRTRLFARDVEGLRYAFSYALNDESKGADWRFIPWPDVVAVCDAGLEYWQAFAVEQPASTQPVSPAKPKPPTDAQIQIVVDVLANLATNDYPSSDAAFRDLVEISDWPKRWKDQRLTGWKNTAPQDARDFVKFMTAKATFPAGHELAGQSVLGAFLRKLLERGSLGGDDTDAIAHIVVGCALVPDADSFKKYYAP